MTDNIRGKLQLRGAYADELVAEIERLTADNERLREQVASLQASYTSLITGVAQLEIERLRSDNERLLEENNALRLAAGADERENERLTAALQEIANMGTGERVRMARRALEQKP